MKKMIKQIILIIAIIFLANFESKTIGISQFGFDNDYNLSVCTDFVLTNNSIGSEDKFPYLLGDGKLSKVEIESISPVPSFYKLLVSVPPVVEISRSWRTGFLGIFRDWENFKLIDENFLDISNPFLQSEVLVRVYSNIKDISSLNLGDKSYEVENVELFETDGISGLIGLRIDLKDNDKESSLFFMPHIQSGNAGNVGLLVYGYAQTGNEEEAKAIAQELVIDFNEEIANGTDIFNFIQIKEGVKARLESGDTDAQKAQLKSLLLRLYFPGVSSEEGLLPDQRLFLNKKEEEIIDNTEGLKYNINNLFPESREDLEKNVDALRGRFTGVFRFSTPEDKYIDLSGLSSFNINLEVSIEEEIGEREAEEVKEELLSRFSSLQTVRVFLRDSENKKAYIDIEIPEAQVKIEEGKVKVFSIVNKEINPSELEIPERFVFGNIATLGVDVERGRQKPDEISVNFKLNPEETFITLKSTPMEDFLNEYRIALFLLRTVLRHYPGEEGEYVDFDVDDPEKAVSNQKFYKYLFRYVDMVNMGLEKGEDSLFEVARFTKWSEENIDFLSEKFGGPIYPHLELERIQIFAGYVSQIEINTEWGKLYADSINSLLLPDYEDRMHAVREVAWWRVIQNEPLFSGW